MFETILKGFGLGFFAAIVVLTVIAVWLISHGDRSWLVGALVATILFIAVFLVVIYVAHYRNTIGRFRRMKVPEATFSYNEEQFTVESEFGSATLPWASITDVWRYPRFWLILFGPAQFSTLPLDCLDPETQAFISRKTQRGPAA